MSRQVSGIIIALTFLFAGQAQAGTIGISGLWDFTETEPYVQYDPSGIPMYAENFSTLTGQFNFDTGVVNFDPIVLLGTTLYMSGTIADNGDGTYAGDLQFAWAANLWSGDILWDILDNGDNTATVYTLDGDGDGIPGNQLLEGPFLGFSPVINGQLNAVPVPASVWLFGSGLLGLVGMAKRKKSYTIVSHV